MGLFGFLSKKKKNNVTEETPKATTPAPEPETDEQIFRDWLKAAEQGDDEAQFTVGVMYENGQGTVANSEKALYWYEKAAEQGNAEGQFNCGFLYLKAENNEKACYWLEKAAKQGDANAQFCYGLALYDNDKKNAYRWFLKAEEQGHKQAHEWVLNMISKQAYLDVMTDDNVL